MWMFPRFQPGNFEINKQLVQQMEDIAAKKSCTPAQLAINWKRGLMLYKYAYDYPYSRCYNNRPHRGKQ